MTPRRMRLAGRSLCVGVAMVGAAAVAAELIRSRLAERAADAREREARAGWERLRGRRPASSAAATAALERRLAEVEDGVAARHRGMLAPTEERGAPPAREGAFFDLAWFADAMLASAGAANVAVRPGERFGFAAYSERAPAAEEVDTVLRQSWLVERLLEVLFAAEPATLEGVWRETQVSGGSSLAGGRPLAADEFLLESRVSLRRHPGVRTQAIRVAFVGATPCLRRFLNGLLGQEIPWFVRSVELEAAPAPALPGTEGSRFTVVVETVEAVELSAAEAKT